ncbi:hypothetical protein NIES4101_56260 [Calothrix sp. NIES-4101]|nr:hypothetical protein NIES4101_56260 [Calothrix sp. NIES-4101]
MMERFFEEFQVLLNSGSPSGISMLAFIKRSLKQFNLLECYSPSEILSDAFMRGVERIERGEQIENPLGWIRATAFNIIRERSRSQARVLQLEESWLESSPSSGVTPNEELTENFQLVEMALKMLNPDEQELLTLKIIDNLSWKEIVEQYQERGFTDVSEGTLRKRKERILKRLRKIYHSLELQIIIQNQLYHLESSHQMIQSEPMRQRLSKDTLTRWKNIISAYQRYACENQNCYTTTSVSVNPFFLPRKSISPSLLRDKDFRGQACLYFICDATANIVLYVGDTRRTSEPMQGVYDCHRYIECYKDINSEHGLKTALEIAYWSNCPEGNPPRHEFASTLINEWKTPLNKENWLC